MKNKNFVSSTFPKGSRRKIIPLIKPFFCKEKFV